MTSSTATLTPTPSPLTFWKITECIHLVICHLYCSNNVFEPYWAATNAVATSWFVCKINNILHTICITIYSFIRQYWKNIRLPTRYTEQNFATFLFPRTCLIEFPKLPIKFNKGHVQLGLLLTNIIITEIERHAEKFDLLFRCFQDNNSIRVRVSPKNQIFPDAIVSDSVNVVRYIILKYNLFFSEDDFPQNVRYQIGCNLTHIDTDVNMRRSSQQ